jgi:hypothetical protein
MHMNKMTIFIALTLSAASPLTQAGEFCTNENVRVTTTTPTSDFVDNNDGTVTHTPTGLMWMRCALGQNWSGTTCSGSAGAMTWGTALNTAANINSGTSDEDGDGAAGFAGHVDWRVPNINELSSIVERRCYSPSINEILFPGTAASTHFWSSSTTVAYRPGNGWWVAMSNGLNSWGAKSSTANVRLVRNAP